MDEEKNADFQDSFLSSIPMHNSKPQILTKIISF